MTAQTRTRRSITDKNAEVLALRNRLDSFMDEMDPEDGTFTLMADKYSERNAALIAMQMPGAVEVRGFKAWQEVGRQVRKGEHGMRILAPAGSAAGTPGTVELDGTPGEDAKPGRKFFRLVSVFDISQTDQAI
jgi:hypothetical protein